MKKAIILAALALTACNGNDSRTIRTSIEAKRGAAVAITSCAIVIGRENGNTDANGGKWYDFTEKAHVIVGNRSMKDARIEVRLDALGKDGRILLGTIFEGTAKAGTTTSLENLKNVPSPAEWIEGQDYDATDSYRCALS